MELGSRPAAGLAAERHDRQAAPNILKGLPEADDAPEMGFLLPVIVVLAAVGISGHAFLLRRLRIHHSDLWEELGSPTSILNNSISNGLSVQKHIRSGSFESLDDPVLAQTSKALRWLGRVYVTAFVVYLAAFAVRAAA